MKVHVTRYGDSADETLNGDAPYFRSLNGELSVYDTHGVQMARYPAGEWATVEFLKDGQKPAEVLSCADILDQLADIFRVYASDQRAVAARLRGYAKNTARQKADCEERAQVWDSAVLECVEQAARLRGEPVPE